MTNKVCLKCNLDKDISEYYFSYNKKFDKNYIRRECKKCENLRSREYHNKNKEKRKAQHKEWRNKTKYGLASGEYELILKSQNGVCAICKNKSERKNLAVDHSHKTGNVRGLLCNNCNNGLGRFMDNKSFLMAAIEYLNKND